MAIRADVAALGLVPRVYPMFPLGLCHARRHTFRRGVPTATSTSRRTAVGIGLGVPLLAGRIVRG